ncbi:hypothetical protein JW859_08220 [bacterium]|nr:hypothetical protein [bacterium]
MKKLFVLVAALVLILAASCDTKNIGTGGPLMGPQVTVTVPTGMFGAQDATWTVTWTDSTAPYAITMNMGGGTTANVPATTATSPFTQVFTMVNASQTDDATYTYTVTVTDGNGNAGTATATYTVGPLQNQDPTIDSVTYTAPTLTVNVSDPDAGDTLTVTVTEPTGLAADTTSRVASQVSGSAAFTWSATDIIAGGSGDTTITVDDGNGGTDSTSQTIAIAAIVIPAGALAAVPATTAATTADTVTIVVIAGDFSNNFQYMNGAGVTVESGGAYVDGTLNVGAPGGEQKFVDGVWAGMSSAPNSFLLPDDFMIQENAIDGGLVRIDFNVTPIGGANVTSGGALFNFGMSFGAAGTYTLGFEEFRDVKRTYFSDTDSTEYYWDDITNNYTDVPNSITVT